MTFFHGNRPVASWAVALAALLTVGAATGPACAQTFGVGANFTTQTYSATTGEPPDTMGAAGPNHFVAFNNDTFAIFNKDGSLVSRVSPTSFWTSALGSNPGGLSDPRILYDSASQRWIAVMITTDEMINNRILFARSNTADPTQGFQGVSLTTTNNRFADFPTLGLDANGVYVGTNNFTSGGSFSSEGLYSLPKADLLASTPSLARVTKFATLSSNMYGYTLQAPVNFGPKLASDPTPVVATSATSSTRYNFSTLSGTTASGATLSGASTKTVQSFSTPTASPQPGSSITLDNGERNISANVVQVGNFLYAVMGTTAGGRTAVRWTIANASTSAVVQQGTISSGTLSYFFPSIAVNAAGDVVIGFSGSSSSTYGSAYAVVGASAGGAPGGNLTFGAPVQTKAGVDFYDGTRWGDYSATTVDPADPGIFWTHQEYAAARTGGSNNWNWATNATEVVPVKTGERRWSNAAGGSFETATNYFGSAAPLASDHVIFSRANAAYTVTYASAAMSDRASVRQGDVSWDVSGGGYTLTNSSAATPSLTVGEFQGTASLAIAGGALQTVNAVIGGASGGRGELKVNAGAQWHNDGQVVVGSQGAGALTINGQGLAYVGANLSIGPQGTLNLNGGTLRLAGYARAGALNFSGGTVQLAGDRSLANDATIADFFGAAPTVGVGKSLVVEGKATLSSSASLTLAGGTLAAQSLELASGSMAVSTQTSQAAAAVNMQAGSAIQVTGGELSLGDALSASGFEGSGALAVGANKVTILDADVAAFGATSTTTLGAAGAGGTLAAANGLSLAAGGQIVGFGVLDTPDDAGKPLISNGAISGNSALEPMTLLGFTTGAGSLDNVDIKGDYSPGAGAGQTVIGSARYEGSLDIELGGVAPGAEFDQVVHSMNAGAAELGGALTVSLVGGFSPSAGDSFTFLTATGGVTGSFASTLWPTLGSGLGWSLAYGANDVTLSVISTQLAADFDGDQDVDADDLMMWQTGFGIDAGATHMQGDADGNGAVDGADFLVWQQQLGSQSGVPASEPAPEPACALLGVLSTPLIAGWRRRCVASQTARQPGTTPAPAPFERFPAASMTSTSLQPI